MKLMMNQEKQRVVVVTSPNKIILTHHQNIHQNNKKEEVHKKYSSSPTKHTCDRNNDTRPFEYVKWSDVGVDKDGNLTTICGVHFELLTYKDLRTICSRLQIKNVKNARKEKMRLALQQSCLNKDTTTTTNTTTNTTYNEEDGHQPVMNRTQIQCPYRLLNILFADEFASRLSQLSYFTTTSSHQVSEEEEKEIQFWKDVQCAYQRKLDRNFDTFHFWKDDAHFTTHHHHYCYDNASQRHDNNGKMMIDPSKALPHDWTTLREMWKRIHSEYMWALKRFQLAVTHPFISFCNGKLDIYYLRKHMLRHPDLNTKLNQLLDTNNTNNNNNIKKKSNHLAKSSNDNNNNNTTNTAIQNHTNMNGIDSRNRQENGTTTEPTATTTTNTTTYNNNNNTSIGMMNRTIPPTTTTMSNFHSMFNPAFTSTLAYGPPPLTTTTTDCSIRQNANSNEICDLATAIQEFTKIYTSHHQLQKEKFKLLQVEEKRKQKDEIRREEDEKRKRELFLFQKWEKLQQNIKELRHDLKKQGDSVTNDSDIHSTDTIMLEIKRDITRLMKVKNELSIRLGFQSSSND